MEFKMTKPGETKFGKGVPLYSRQQTEKSYCPNCRKNPTLLMADAEVAAFYICWTCKEVRQIGVGLVEESDD